MGQGQAANLDEKLPSRELKGQKGITFPQRRQEDFIIAHPQIIKVILQVQIKWYCLEIPKIERRVRFITFAAWFLSLVVRGHLCYIFKFPSDRSGWTLWLPFILKKKKNRELKELRLALRHLFPEVYHKLLQESMKYWQLSAPHILKSVRNLTSALQKWITQSAISKQAELGARKAFVRFMFSFPYDSWPLPIWLHFQMSVWNFLLVRELWG